LSVASRVLSAARFRPSAASCTTPRRIKVARQRSTSFGNASAGTSHGSSPTAPIPGWTPNPPGVRERRPTLRDCPSSR
jgi:hypothetical protein